VSILKLFVNSLSPHMSAYQPQHNLLMFIPKTLLNFCRNREFSASFFFLHPHIILGNLLIYVLSEQESLPLGETAYVQNYYRIFETEYLLICLKDVWSTFLSIFFRVFFPDSSHSAFKNLKLTSKLRCRPRRLRDFDKPFIRAISNFTLVWFEATDTHSSNYLSEIWALFGS
jgi:hypothetical protein